VTGSKSKYTDEEIAFIEKALREKCSAAKIASMFSEEFRDITRNAITGVIRRNKTLDAIGLQGDGSFRKTKTVAYDKPKKQKLNPTNIARKKEARKSDPGLPNWTIKGRGQSKPPQAISVALSPDSRNIPLADLEPGMCRYATNDAYRGERHLFCGHKTELGSSWCPYHENIVFPNGRRAA
jgi:GcrA cell cycle regulator